MSTARPVSSSSGAPQEQAAADSLVEKGREKGLPPGLTLRIKPDRRRQQLPIPPDRDRRRPR